MSLTKKPKGKDFQASNHNLDGKLSIGTTNEKTPKLDVNTPKDKEVKAAKEVNLAGEMKANTPQPPVVEINFYTKKASEMVFSQRKETELQGTYFVQGSDWFDKKISVLNGAITQDDPFADQLLLDIEVAIFKAGELFKKRTEEIIEKIKNKLELLNAKISFNDDMHCYSCKISLKNKLAFNVVWLAKELDNVLYYSHLADTHGFITSVEYKELWSEVKHAYYSALNLVNCWVSVSITREDLSQNTQRVQKAFEKNNRINLSREVLFLEQRADSAPRITAHPYNKMDEQIKQRLETLYPK